MILGLNLSQKQKRAAATLVDQAVVSLGSFAATILLARTLMPPEYGLFALLFGVFLTLQLVNASLVFYPLTVRLSNLAGVAHARLLSESLALTAAICVPLCLLIGAGLLCFNRPELVLPATSAFLFWQFQQGTRRVLFADFRHDTALFGDTIASFGHGVVICGLAFFNLLSVKATFLSMAITSGLGFGIQLWQLRPSAGHRLSLNQMLRFLGCSGVRCGAMTFMERVAPVVDQTINSLSKVPFVVDPIAGVEYSRSTSIVSSAYKRHGRILEIALRESLRDSNRHNVWHDSAFRVSREADVLATTQDFAACRQSAA